MYPPQTGPTQLINPKCTEPYYTKPVQSIEECGHTQCRWNPLQAGPTQLINPTCTEPYYTRPA